MTSVLDAQAFNWVLNFDPKKSDVNWKQSEEYSAQINSVAHDVIALIPTVKSAESQEKIAQFSSQLKVVNKHFKQKTKNSFFDEALEGLALSETLYKGKLSPYVSKLLKSESYIALILNKEITPSQLKEFLRDFNRVLQAKISKEDLAVLKPLIHKCFLIAGEYKGKDASKIDVMLDASIKLIQFHLTISSPTYQNLLYYKQGQLKGKDIDFILKELTTFVGRLKDYGSSNHLPLNQAEYLRIYDNLKVIQKEQLAESYQLTSLIETMREIPIVKEGILKRFQVGLNNLDLKSPHLEKDVERLKQDVREMYPKNSPKIKKLINCLNEIKNPSELKAGSTELKFIEKFKHDYEKLKDVDYSIYEDRSIELGRKNLLRVLKKNSDSLESIDKVLNEYPQLKTQVMKYRFKAFLKENSIEHLHIVDRFPAMIASAEEFAYKIALPDFRARWEDVKEILNTETKGKFSEVIEIVKKIDIKEEKEFEFLAQSSLNSFIRLLDLEELDTSLNVDFKKHLKDAAKSLKKLFPEVFLTYYNNKFKDRHILIGNYSKYIEQIYSQDDDPSRNLGEGSCFQNSLGRIMLLLQDPDLATRKIKMGSTFKDRFVGATIKLTHKLSDKFSKNLKKVGQEFSYSDTKALAAQSQLEEISSYGIEERNWRQFSEEAPISRSNIRSLIRWAHRNHETQIVLTFSSPPHAFNIQIDAEKGIYRLFDDNTFSTKSFPDAKSFLNFLEDYFKAFYPKAKSLVARSYEQAPSKEETSQTL